MAKINAGDMVYSKKHGAGKCLKVDPTNKDFMFLCRFQDKTLAWVSGSQIEPSTTPLA